MQPTERRILFALILITGLAWIAISANRTGTSSQEGISAPQTGFLAPDFTLKTTDRQIVTLSKFKSKAVLLNV